MAKTNPPNNNMNDLFGGPEVNLAGPILNATAMPRGASQPDIKKTEESFDPFGNFGDLTSSLSSQNIAGPKPGQPLNQPRPNPGAGGAKPPTSQQTASSMGPNYSRSFFSDNTPSI